MSYIITYNGYTLQNITNQSVIELLDGISRVPLRISQDPITGQHGGNIWERKLDMRLLLLKGSFFYTDDTSYYAAREAFQQTFFITNTDNRMTITRPDGVTKVVSAKVVDIPLFVEKAGERHECTYEVALKCENPFFLDSSLTSGTITPGTTGGTPVSSPVPSPVGGSTQQLTLYNNGDNDIYPTFAITGNITNPSILNLTTGKTFSINTNIPVGSTLQAYYDTTGLYVQIGTTNYLQYLQGNLFKMQQGINVLTFSGSSFDTNASLTISFYNQYISI